MDKENKLEKIINSIIKFDLGLITEKEKMIITARKNGNTKI